MSKNVNMRRKNRVNILDIFRTDCLTHSQLLKRRRREIMGLTFLTLVILIAGSFWSYSVRPKGGVTWITHSLTDTVTAAISSTIVHHSDVSDEVKSYLPTVEKYAEEYGISDYVPVIEAIMQQESAGNGTDVMQCSECYLNTEYDQSPDGIKDPDYSIQIGVEYFAECLKTAECTGISDSAHLKLALQGYNFGHNYITWALERDGGYTLKNSQDFSGMMAENYGWSSYGDPEYVEHVLQYVKSEES